RPRHHPVSTVLCRCPGQDSPCEVGLRSRARGLLHWARRAELGRPGLDHPDQRSAADSSPGSELTYWGNFQAAMYASRAAWLEPICHVCSLAVSNQTTARTRGKRTGRSGPSASLIQGPFWPPTSVEPSSPIRSGLPETAVIT